MPKLQLFVACEKVIIDEDTKAISILSLLDALTVLPRDDREDFGSMAPMKWAAISLWRREETDSPDATYEQQIKLLTPEAETVVDSGALSFKLVTLGHRQTFNVVGFPVKTPGKYALQLLFRRSDRGDEWQLAETYPIFVAHVPRTDAS